MEYETVHVPGEIVPLAKHQIPLRRADWKSGPDCNPQWEIRGGKLIVQPTTIRIRK